MKFLHRHVALVVWHGSHLNEGWVLIHLSPEPILLLLLLLLLDIEKGLSNIR